MLLCRSFLVFAISICHFISWLLIIKIKDNLPLKTVFINVLILFFLWIPLPFISDVLSVGGKSFLEYTYLFLIGYYFISNDSVIALLETKRRFTLSIGIVASITNIYLFLWSHNQYNQLNIAANHIAKWYMILALLGYSKKYLDFCDIFTCFMAKNSFRFYFIHYICVVIAEFFLCRYFENHIIVFFLSSAISYILAFLIIILIQNHSHFKCIFT